MSTDTETCREDDARFVDPLSYRELLEQGFVFECWCRTRNQGNLRRNI